MITFAQEQFYSDKISHYHTPFIRCNFIANAWYITIKHESGGGAQKKQMDCHPKLTMAVMPYSSKNH